MTRPRISVVVPVYNRSDLVVETLDSILSQTITDWEAVVVDDASTDDSLEVLKVAERSDPRIRAISRPPEFGKGAGPSRNAGLAAASAEFVVFLDSDDLLKSDALEQRIAAMESYDFVVSQGQFFDRIVGDNSLLAFRENFADEDDLDRFIRLDWPWQTTGPTWRRRWLLENDVRWPDQHTSHDDTLFHLAALACNPRYTKRFDVGPDFYFRTKDTDHAGLCEAFAEPWNLKAAAPGFLSTARRIRSGDLPFECYAPSLLGLAFFLAGHLYQNNRASGLLTWCRSFALGMVSSKQFLLGSIHLLAQRTRFAQRVPKELLHERWGSAVFRKKPGRSFGHEPSPNNGS